VGERSGVEVGTHNMITRMVDVWRKVERS
jgi:hypothetical protein